MNGSAPEVAELFLAVFANMTDDVRLKFSPFVDPIVKVVYSTDTDFLAPCTLLLLTLKKALLFRDGTLSGPENNMMFMILSYLYC